MKTTRKLVILVLAGFLMFLLPAMSGDLEPSGPPAPTMKTLDEVEPRIPISAADIPLIITTPGSYYLTEDTSFTGTANHAIVVACDDVTIDLAGYTLKGPDTGNTSGVYMYGRNNVEIRNGTIRDFGWPAIVENGGGYNHRVINIRALSNGYGICLPGYGHLVKDCTVAANAYYGMNVGAGVTVTGNNCYNNNNDGIIVNTGCTVIGNTCYDNNGDGIVTSTGCTITNNTVYSNSNDGIHTNTGCAIIGNASRDNTNYGIYASGYCLVDQNAAYNNGINLSAGTGSVLGVNCAP